MACTVRDLLVVDVFHLRIVAGVAEPEDLDREIAWAHSSDLADPTPWLLPDQLLLTDGLQLHGATQAFADEYVRRLRHAGVIALGLATQIVHPRVPEVLVTACEEVGLPLLEVAERAPFMAIIRYVSDAVTRERQSALERSLAAHRSVARAAVRPDGLSAVLRTLEDHMHGWVLLTNATGGTVRASALGSPSPAVIDQIHDSVRTMLARRRHAALTFAQDRTEVRLQTLGSTNHLSGVLVVATDRPLGAEGSDLLASVVGIASIALEQHGVIGRSRARLRTSLLELVLGGALSAQEVLERRLWERLPRPPLRVIVARELPATAARVLDDLEVLAGDRGDEMFFGPRDAGLVIIAASRSIERPLAALEPFGLRAGISGEGDWGDVHRLLEEAGAAWDRSGDGRRVVRFERLHGDGLIAAMVAGGGVPMARRALAPLTRHPQGEVLRTTLQAWLAAGCAADRAAEAIGVHRQTVAARVGAAADVLDVDLSAFDERARLWALFQLLEDDGSAPSARS